TAFLTTWSERLRSMRSLHMVFRQEKQLRVMRQPLVAQGELWLKGDTLRYVLTNLAGDIELIVRLDKQTIKTYYTALNTLEVVDFQTTGVLPQALPFWYPEPEALAKDMRLSCCWSLPACTPYGWCPEMPEYPCKRCGCGSAISSPKKSCRWR